MSDFVVGRYYPISELVECVRHELDADSVYMVYMPKGFGDFLVDSAVFVGAMPDFDDDDREIFPLDVLERGLEPAYMQEHFQDVVFLAYKQKPDASLGEVVACLNHYAHYDDFLDLI